MSSETAGIKPEEGGDDVKSAWPLYPGLHTRYNGRYNGQRKGDLERIPSKPFVNDGLLPALRGLSGSDERLKVAEVFKETYSRMLSGYLLRDVVNLVDGIHFQSKDEIFTLAHLYESMLKEMRDAAGDSGEFYTPRPVVKLIVDRTKPRLGETVLDPACGTGGFLVEAYEYLKPLAKNSKDQIKLQSETLYGVEKKPLPYLLGTMNLLLHGVENPNIRRDNAGIFVHAGNLD